MKCNPTNTTIGFIGTGVMGKAMASHLIRAGYSLLVYNRTKEKAEELIALGATWKDSAAEVAAGANVIITIIGYPKDVQETYFGGNGILANAAEGSYLIDMTTSTPALAKQIYQAANETGIHSLDAPVSGGDIGAKNATLTIMVGGDQAAFDAVSPIFHIMGNNVILQGPAGSGQHTKMSNQIAIASTMISTCEAILYAERAGLDPTNVLKSITAGSANSWSLANYGPRIIAANYSPGFFVKHFIKDMNIALEEAANMGIQLPGLALVKSLYEELAAKGEENSGTHALYKLLAGQL